MALRRPVSVLRNLQVLVEKARNEAEEAQRILLAALNGLAGLMILDGDRAQAVALYRQVCPQCSSGRRLLYAAACAQATLCQSAWHGIMSINLRLMVLDCLRGLHRSLVDLNR